MYLHTLIKCHLHMNSHRDSLRAAFEAASLGFGAHPVDIFPWLRAVGGKCTGTAADTMLALASTMFACTCDQSPVMLQHVNRLAERPVRQVSLVFRS